MKLRARLVVLLVGTSLAPLAASGLVAARVAELAQVQQARQLQARRVEGLGLFVRTWVDARMQSLRLSTGPFAVDRLDAEERLGWLRLVYRSTDAAGVVALVDGSGALVAGPVRAASPEELALLGPGRELADDARVAALLAAGPELVARGGGLGTPHGAGGAPWAVVPVALPAAGGLWLLADLSLRGVHEGLRPGASEGLALLHPEAGVVAGEGHGLVLARDYEAFGGQLAGELEAEARGEVPATLNAFVTVLPDGARVEAPWLVVASVPREDATAAARAIRARVGFLFALALAAAGLSGLVAASQLARPVDALRRATLRLADGDDSVVVDDGGTDEVRDLARAFNHMARSLARSRGLIERQHAEIRAFNAELQARVDKRTRQLAESQARLVGAARMAAVAHLGAGISHALNNPVAGILGLAQVARAQAPEGPLAGHLRGIEEQARRVRDALGSLAGFVAEGEGRPETVELHGLLDEVLALVAESLGRRGVTVVHHPGEPLPVRVDRRLLGQAFAELLRSLAAGIRGGGEVHVRGHLDEDRCSLVLALPAGARPAGDDWMAAGMGFWVARHTLEEQGGTLEEPDDAASAWRLVLPRDGARETNIDRAGPGVRSTGG